MNKSLFTTIGIMLIMSFSLWSQEDSFTLDQAIKYAISHNDHIKNAQLDIEIAQSKIKEITAQGLPQLSSDVDFQNFVQIPVVVIPAQAFDPTAPSDALAELKFGVDYKVTAGVQLTQLIFNGSYLVGLQASRAFKRTTSLMMNKSMLDVKKDVTLSYYTVAMLQDNLDAIISQKESLESLYRETSILNQEGVIEKTATLQIKLSLLQLEAAENQIEQQLISALTLLKMNMGMDLNAKIAISQKMDEFFNLAASVDIPNELESGQNINSKLLHHQLTLDMLNLKNEKMSYLPTLSGFISHQQVAQLNDFSRINKGESWFPTTLWGVILNVPLWTSGATKAKVQQALLKTYKTQNNIHQLDNALKTQFQKALSDYNTAKELYFNQKESIEIAQSIMDFANVKFKEGVLTSMELTQHQNQVLKAQSDIILTAFKLLSAKLTLDQLLSKL